MNETQNSPTCERASDLIAFLYNEATAEEKREFELHLKECSGCSEEVASFGLVRESITAWRDEALSGFVSTPLPNKATKKSAVAALRQFLDLSPLWLKGATAFAVLAFCLLAALAIVRLQTNNSQTTSANVNQRAIYTDEDVKRMVQEAVAKQERVKQPSESTLTSTTAKPPKPKGPSS